MAYNIKTPFGIATHGKKYSSTSSLSNKTKAFAFGMVSGIPYYNDGSAVQSLYGAQTKFCTTQFDAVTSTTGATLTNIVGLTGFSLVAAGTYRFEIHIAGVSTANCGMKVGLGYTTLTATSIESMAQGFTASAVACQHTTTSTTGMSLFAATAAYIDVIVRGQLVVLAAGTVAVQMAQNAAHADTTSAYVGSYASFIRVS